MLAKASWRRYASIPLRKSPWGAMGTRNVSSFMIFLIILDLGPGPGTCAWVPDPGSRTQDPGPGTRDPGPSPRTRTRPRVPES